MRARTLDPAEPAGAVDPILQELVRWTDGVPPDAATAVDGWSSAAWDRFRVLVLRHGLAAFLAEALRRSGPAAPVPPDLVAWLEVQEGRIAERAACLRADLAAILERASARGIAVMPLKGALLLDEPAIDARRRPMADLDLLVRPSERAAVTAVLRELGYRRRRPEVGPKPETFVRRHGRGVVDRAGEHPDNPRPVEVHVTVQRHLWEWTAEDRLTAALWASAAPGVVAGQPAIVPARELLFEHVAVHATTALMRGRGRLVQWRDLAGLTAAGAAPALSPAEGETWVAPELAYPSLALAARVLPDIASAIDLEALAAASRPEVVAWARATPLDGRAGLETGRTRMPPAGRFGRWERWRPSRLRLAVAYGAAPLPIGLGRLALAMARYGLAFGWSTSRRRAARRLRPWLRRLRRLRRLPPLH